jgi:glutamyl-tRNA reductase
VPDVTERAQRNLASREVSSTIIALGKRLEQIREEQLERYQGKIRTLEPAQRGAVEALIKGILNKILHGPVCELNAHAGTPEQHALAQLVRRIFGVA